MKRISEFNEWFAAKATIVFGTMWMFYAFFVYGLLPLIPSLKPYESQLFYWSGWIQLWALPLLLVGSIVLGKQTEKRDSETHDAVMGEFAETKRMHADVDERLSRIENKLDRLV